MHIYIAADFRAHPNRDLTADVCKELQETLQDSHVIPADVQLAQNNDSGVSDKKRRIFLSLQSADKKLLIFERADKKLFIFEHADKKLFPDEHDVDIIGYGGASDDDHSSVRRCLLGFRSRAW